MALNKAYWNIREEKKRAIVQAETIEQIPDYSAQLERCQNCTHVVDHGPNTRLDCRIAGRIFATQCTHYSPKEYPVPNTTAMTGPSDSQMAREMSAAVMDKLVAVADYEDIPLTRAECVGKDLAKFDCQLNIPKSRPAPTCYDANGKDEDSKGIQHDEGKQGFDLIPLDVLQYWAKVYTDSCSEYPARNWEKGIKYSRVYNSALRHLFAFWDGEDKDKKSGLYHVAHAMWRCATLLAYQLRGMASFDDRVRRG